MMKHRYDTVKHFFADVFTDGQIERTFRYEPPIEDTQTAAEKAANIAEKYADMELVPTTLRTDREVKRDKYDEVILGKSWIDKQTPYLEIYDDYRE